MLLDVACLYRVLNEYTIIGGCQFSSQLTSETWRGRFSVLGGVEEVAGRRHVACTLLSFRTPPFFPFLCLSSSQILRSILICDPRG